MNNNLLALSQKKGSQKLKSIQKILDEGQNPNIQTKISYYTPLMFACINNDVNLVKLLLKYKADPNIKNSSGSTSFMFACHNGNIEIIKLLLKKYKNINDRNYVTSFTPLYIAIINPSIDGYNKDITKLLLKSGADPNIKYIDDNTVLMAIYFNQKNSVDIIKLLLKYGAKINTKNKLGNSALMISVGLYNNLKTTKLLLKNGADPNIKNIKGETPLMMAYRKENIKMQKLLLKYGAK